MSPGNTHHMMAVPGFTEARLTITGTEQLTPALIGAVESLCARVEAEADEPVVVLRLGLLSRDGEPGPPAAPAAIHLVSRWERALRRLERAGAATFAIAEGWCGGTALEALLSCDYRIGTPDLRLAPLMASGEPWPGVIVHRLAGQLGTAQVRRLVLFGEELPAARALEVGLVDEITDDTATALTAGIALARRLSGPEVAIRRRLLLEAGSTSFEEALGVHLAACDRSLRRLQATAAP
ncbi:enoyl-CoA-hydratase DpgB [Streptomyces sp. NPDC056500]|uniref:enoyl-CoA-hydratase DpgB n=1 Tax=Streptomyces sp. NPDC056500 TaxID=3345840 RepID=UPI0036CB4A50